MKYKSTKMGESHLYIMTQNKITLTSITGNDLDRFQK